MALVRLIWHKKWSSGPSRALTLMALMCCLLASSVSEAVLFITPTRLVFEGRDRAATVTFLNQKNEPKTYRLFWREKKQGPDGKFVNMVEGDDVPWSAQNLIRYSPRQVTVEPQESQVVRFALRKPKNLPEGEYRSHLVIEEQEPPKNQEDEQIGGDSIGLLLHMLYSYTMPILVVHGDQEVAVKIRDFDTYRSSGPEWVAEALIDNTGGTSALGIVRLEWEGPEGTEVLTEGGSVNIYLPQRERKLSLNYRRPNTPGRLRLAYYEDRHAKRLTVKLPSKKLIAEAYLK
jgi:fimbrial chaperone protein